MSRYYRIISDVPAPSTRFTDIAQFVILTIAMTQTGFASQSEDVQFNSSFLRSNIDVSAYSKGNPVPPGNYTVDLYVNDKWTGRAEVKFEDNPQQPTIARPCFTLQLISMMGIDLDKLPADTINALKNNDACLPMSSIIKDIAANYDVSNQQLNIQAPQIYLLRHARGYVNPALWDNGISAGMLQYDYNAYHSEMSGANAISTQYLGLRGGVNWDVWRLRYRGTFNWTNDGGLHYSNTSSYLERAIIPLQSKLVLGESTTDGQVFDSVGFRGAMLTSDDRMYMDSQRGYAPVISGVANTNALVRVSQRGVRIYESTVPPGPFVIDDLYPTGTGGICW